ncbi:heparinase II/III domain-containing protein [Paenibacillus gansuensis]|uniref:Heparinase II/III family protein n=1 Tax=Paenibacillus gansuensis TaxID=306542 RepID=A0ABW5PD97_9BACL
MRISEKAKRYRWAEETLGTLSRELDLLLEQEMVIPAEPGGWWHQYVCPVHHTELEFDPYETDAVAFRCPHGCHLEGEPYRGAWLVFKHQSLARFALQAAAVYAGTGEQRYAELGKQIIVRYAEMFPKYPVHPDAQPWMLKGRAFHQALTEAIWSTTLLRAFLLLTDEDITFADVLPAVEQFLDLLEQSMVQYRHILIDVKDNPENNYTAWLNASLSCIYAIRGDKDKLAGLVEGKGGILHHLDIGVNRDGFEFEGSTYYHVFVLRAYLIAAEMAERAGLDLYEAAGAGGQTFRSMFDALAGLSNDHGILPALHDGPYRRTPYSREIAEVVEIGLSRYRNLSYVPLLGAAYEHLFGNRVRGGLEALLFGVDEWDLGQRYGPRESLLLPETGFAVLRHPESPLSVLADFGPHGGSHGHFDKLHISLSHTLGDLSPDFGMVPYGSALRKEWYAETASHNTVSVNGISQAPHRGECIRFETLERGAFLHLRSSGAYEGCVMDRRLLLTGSWLLDWFEVELEDAGTIDWHLYSAAGLIPGDRDGNKVQWVPVSSDDWHDRKMNPYIKPLLCLHGCSSGSQADFQLRQVSQEQTNGNVTMSLWLEGNSEVTTVTAPGPADDPSRETEGLIYRQLGTKARFIAIYTSGPERAVLGWKQGTDGIPVLHITLNGQTDEIAADHHTGLPEAITTIRRS